LLSKKQKLTKQKKNVVLSSCLMLETGLALSALLILSRIYLFIPEKVLILQANCDVL